jgi:hypothetical protein
VLGDPADEADAEGQKVSRTVGSLQSADLLEGKMSRAHASVPDDRPPSGGRVVRSPGPFGAS